MLSLAMLRFRIKRPTPDSSTIGKLPPELLLRITSYLPPTSAGAFSLCSKRLYTLLAIPYLKCQHGHPPFNKTEFLRLLETGLPDHIVCYYCEKLHAIKHLQRHIKYATRCDIKTNELMRTYIHPRFSYVIFQMAMKRHRQGLTPSPLLTHLSHHSWSWFGPDSTKTSARVIDGSLLLRQQNIRLVHPNNEFLFNHRPIMICPHAGQLRGIVGSGDCGGVGRYDMEYTPGSVDADYTPTSVECECHGVCGGVVQPGTATRDEGNWSGLLRCRACPTEFRIDTLGIGREGKAFIVTRWKDLGEGRDARDGVWRAHMGEKVGGGGRGGGGTMTICKRFEGEGWRGGLESLVTPREMKRFVRYRYGFCEV